MVRFAVFLAAALAISGSAMAQQVGNSSRSNTQHNITIKMSGVTQPIQAQSFSFTTSPRELAAQHGAMTGRRQHEPITITKPIDQTSPQFAALAASGKHLDSVVIEFSEGGKVYQVVKLSDVQIGSVDKDQTGNPPTEKIKFVFRQITYTISGGKTAGDSWDAK